MTEPRNPQVYSILCGAMENAKANGFSLLKFTDEELTDDLIECGTFLSSESREDILDAVAVWRNSHTQF